MQLDRAVDVFVQPVEHHTVLLVPHKTPIHVFHVRLFNLCFFMVFKDCMVILPSPNPTHLPEWQLGNTC